MVFISICTALYEYAPQADNELAIQEGELIYVLEKSTEDDWWKAKKRAPSEDEEEPVGLIPYNYVEEVSVVSFRGNVADSKLGFSCCRKTWPTSHHDADKCLV